MTSRKPRMRRRQLAECLQGQLLFGVLRAAGQEDDVRRLDAGQCSQSHSGGIVAIGLGAVELERAGDVQLVLGRSDAEEPLGIVRVLRGHQIDLAQQPADQRPKRR